MKTKTYSTVFSYSVALDHGYENENEVPIEKVIAKFMEQLAYLVRANLRNAEDAFEIGDTDEVF